jgi:hypothetical protein
MVASKIFIGSMTILTVLNLFAYNLYPSMAILSLSGIIGMFTLLLSTGVLVTLNVFGSGFDSGMVKNVIFFFAIFGLLAQFQFNVFTGYNFTLGLGLLTNMLNIFSGSDFGSVFGFYIIFIIGILAFVSGFIMMNSGD